ncbi:hypothetical protein L0935_02680 [Paracidovorax citrulli]|uniref:3-oxoacyl-(Acyl-carrier-protein (ACP)) synthase III C terminal domain protein n=1 Tax=Paracidovorax citrulli (strain AAC00-1) TaxID=397945 RepID=A1TTQ8_PARC0|nr:3-oxoacyl-[acyl-carrier-protein] synthase III C-terminal domain-containing protein [Paracidovorax citrulli]ABM34346.1 3-oxoacyl-(acyl-carrier-protein (ACP)) synthase III C terminal domain protein [Paracidovorax citrulli AAC00-1]ATG93822.1 hypothetical protein CQB05_07110 [Paracidovorax citrulli]PVY63787.1 3-oxoacyl-[acyl-carrier-protein] synthase III [Paracidovorax citrulli]REG67252.1 3-oxoacyl-[acyl-carrier-protein] synthase III [Paracidovorax citrulli]RLJ91812.1 3-oxoacyl-[acyl-carrier-pr
MPEIGIVATAAYVPPVAWDVRSFAAEQAPDARQASGDRLLRACFEENLRSHGIDLEELAAVRSGTDATRLSASTGICAVAREQCLEPSEMLAKVARRVLQAEEADQLAPVSTFLVCQSCLEGNLTVSGACRVQAELGQGRTPFAVGQLQGASFLLALSLAADLLHLQEDGPGRIAIAAAERWSWPYPRVVGQTTVLGDGAGAVVVEKGSSRGWMLRSVTVRTPEQPRDIYRHIVRGEPWEVDVEELCGLITGMLREAGHAPGDIAYLVPHGAARDLDRYVRERCGLEHAWSGTSHARTQGYLCSAEVPVRLHQLLERAAPRDGDCLVVWGIGFGGALACALLQFAAGGVPR